MPTYDYKCTICGHTFELFQPMSAEPIKECPKCKGLVKRLIGTGAGTIFKGTGFYQTDYKNNSGNNKKQTSKVSKADTKTDNKSETKSENKTESKPESKSENTSGGGKSSDK